MHTTGQLLTLRDSVLGALKSLACVTDVGVFGSLATDSWDEWSDIDVCVACGGPLVDGNLIMAEIHAHLPVQCFRPFSAKDAPNGRYWFTDHSPFHKLDISFHDPADWQRAIQEHQAEGGVMRFPDCRGGSGANGAPAFIWDYTPRQKALFDIVHRVHKHTLAHARRGTSADELSRELADMTTFMAEHPPESIYEERAWTVAQRMGILADMQLSAGS